MLILISESSRKRLKSVRHPANAGLIDTCMSFRIAQLQEVRTATAAHEGWPPGEGPVGFAGRAQDGQGAFGRKGRQRPTSSILRLCLRDGRCGLRDRGARHGVASGQALPCRARLRLSSKCGKGMTGGRSREGREGLGVGDLRRAFANSAVSEIIASGRAWSRTPPSA